MLLNVLKGKIHRATVVQAELDYVGSITIDPVLAQAAGILEYEKVQVVDVDNGNRFETYVIAGEPGSGMICVNGAAAHCVEPNHKVIIMADADVDGAHIATLNLTLFFRYMRPMINAGYVYVAMPPLYRLKWTKGPHDFVYTDAERDRVLAEGKANGRTLPKGEGIQRYKGLGEMSYQELWETTMDPANRVLKQVHIEDALQADETFSMLMGDEVEPRRLFIQRNAHNARWIDA